MNFHGDGGNGLKFIMKCKFTLATASLIHKIKHQKKPKLSIKKKIIKSLIDSLRFSIRKSLRRHSIFQRDFNSSLRIKINLSKRKRKERKSQKLLLKKLNKI